MSIKTIIFVDLEPSKMPEYCGNTTKMTELSLLAVKRKHLLNVRSGVNDDQDQQPRVQQKLVMCFNPIEPISMNTSTGLSNSLLKDESKFNAQSFDVLNNFIERLEKPVCLIAQNGFDFDFPIIQKELSSINACLSDDVMCTDFLYALYDILEGKQHPNSASVAGPISYEALKRTYFFDNNPKPESHRLGYIYKRVIGCERSIEHRAEVDCIDLLKICIKKKEEFVNWVDRNHCRFSEVPRLIPKETDTLSDNFGPECKKRKLV